MMDDLQKQKLALRVSTVSIMGNVLLTVAKLAAGIIAHSSAMVSDAVHSASDIISTVVVIWGVRLSAQREDAEHPYGHERMESAAAVALAGLLMATGVYIGLGGVKTILTGLSGGFVVPGFLALAAAVISIAVKEMMYHYTRAAAKKADSASLMADAWHHRSDALSSVGSLIGIGGALLGFPIMDPIACVIISVVIVKVSFDIARQAFDQMLDRACEPALQTQMRDIVMAQQGVLRLDSLTTRKFGSKIYVDVSIAADGALSVKEGHDIAQAVHEQIELHFPAVKHCMVHVNPYPAKDSEP
ncbi:cation diffusion facilitator family transporter [Oscillospiraceae bacterium LTW-04]|nr:cation diffusion facilitator family transporter [Oscillospiraceae bacterium MB24-C1]